MPLRQLVMFGFAGLGVALVVGLGSAWLIFGGAGHIWARSQRAD